MRAATERIVFDTAKLCGFITSMNFGDCSGAYECGLLTIYAWFFNQAKIERQHCSAKPRGLLIA